MKKLSFTVKTLISCALIAAAASCSDNAGTKSAPAQEAPADSKAAATTNIRYIDADSVARTPAARAPESREQHQPEATEQRLPVAGFDGCRRAELPEQGSGS